jgi:uncharacterized protein
MKAVEHSILKIYASSTDHIGSTMLYEYIVRAARDHGIIGATVYRGIMGYGSSSQISSSKFWELTEKLPVTIEIIDESSKLVTFFQSIEKKLLTMPKGCLATIEPVNILLLKPGKKG